MPNPYVNKVQLGNGTTLIDISGDTATASDVASGKTFHLATGEPATGTASGGVTPAQLVDLIYPVGSLYMSANSVNPGTLFSGTTWTAIQGRFLLGADTTYTAGGTGGSATANFQHSHTTGDHTLTGAESGQKALEITGGEHSHLVTMYHSQSGYGVTIPANSSYLVWNTAVKWADTAMTNRNATNGLNINQPAHTHSVSASDAASAHNHGNTGTSGSASQDIMPPYLAVYIWQRTA